MVTGDLVCYLGNIKRWGCSCLPKCCLEKNVILWSVYLYIYGVYIIMGTLSRGYFRTRQTIPVFNRLGNVAYVQQMKFIKGNRCRYKLDLSALHVLWIYRLEQIQSYKEGTWLGWGKVQGNHPSSRSSPRSPKITSRSLLRSHLKIILEVIPGHFKVKLKNCLKGHVRYFQGRTCKQCSVATKIGQTNL